MVRLLVNLWLNEWWTCLREFHIWYLFQAHEIVRSEILQQILNRVVTKATTPVHHYIGKLEHTTTVLNISLKPLFFYNFGNKI